MRVIELKGIGEKTEKIFAKAGVNNVADLLKYYPRYYDTYNEPVLAKDVELNITHAIKVTFVREITLRRVKNMTIATAYLRDEKGFPLTATWFNAPFMKSNYSIGDVVIMRGVIRERNSNLNFEHPKIFSLHDYQKKMGQMQPVYPLVSGLTNNIVQKAVKEALDIVTIKDMVPRAVVDKYNLDDIEDTVRKIHFPKNPNEFEEARKRMVFDEFFSFLMSVKKLKTINEKKVNPNVIDDFSLVDQIIKNLPYELTNAQKKTLDEVKRDISSNKIMNRLIQGDVGSGKTIIAFLMLIAATNIGQGAMMAPTEVLAKQHYNGLLELIDDNDLDLHIALLVGSMTAKEKRETYEAIKDGRVDIVIGTHAVIQEAVEFNNLVLVVTDEQHRFGVKQREEMSIKGNDPHVCVMSATPIPRSLAIILYGDLDISVIDELPSGRKNIANCVVNNDYRPNAYSFIKKQVEQGRQAYVICPTVEFSEAVEGENVIDYCDKLKKIMPSSINIDYLHGRMKPSEKNEIMKKFSEKDIDILVSTTVVEVGVNVPNATVMMVENAERFGLAQLHQLRGRVGRGKFQSYCIFINGKGNKIPERLEILNKSNDGFYIASKDLELRGPGDFFGVRQSGDFEFKLADIMNDAPILKKASDAVEKILDGSIAISDFERKIIEENINDNINL